VACLLLHSVFREYFTRINPKFEELYVKFA